MLVRGGVFSEWFWTDFRSHRRERKERPPEVLAALQVLLQRNREGNPCKRPQMKDHGHYMSPKG